MLVVRALAGFDLSEEQFETVKLKTLSTTLTPYKVVATIEMWTKLSEQSL